MKNKKVRDIVIAVAILLLLLLLGLGVFFMTQKRESSSGDNDNQIEASMVIKEKDTSATWEKEEFKDETSDKKENLQNRLNKLFGE